MTYNGKVSEFKYHKICKELKLNKVEDYICNAEIFKLRSPIFKVQIKSIFNNSNNKISHIDH